MHSEQTSKKPETMKHNQKPKLVFSCKLLWYFEGRLCSIDSEQFGFTKQIDLVKMILMLTDW